LVLLLVCILQAQLDFPTSAALSQAAKVDLSQMPEVALVIVIGDLRRHWHQAVFRFKFSELDL